jgi:DNA replicative helicase MCM subunit Mcm2 (Cdc46/Mcm family)
MNGELLNLENILQEKVKTLCAKNPAYENMLREVLKADITYENPGFEFKHLPSVSGGHINAMLQAGIIKKSYESNNYTHWRLCVRRQELESILDDIELIRLEDEKACMNACKQVVHPQALLTPEIIKEFEELVKSGQDLLLYWALRLNPRIIGMERERAACLISMASPPDKGGIMRRCHCLIHGPPGTGKSALIAYIKHYFDAIGIAPEATTRSGLTNDGRDNSDGAMVLASGKTLVVEEIEKFDKRTLESMYNAMASPGGEIDINKGGIHEIKNAEFRAIAVGNSIEKLSAPLLDRFSFIFHYEIPSKEHEKKITDDLYTQWLSPKDDYRGIKLRTYLEWIRDFEPEITLEIIKRCQQIKNAYIDLSELKPDIRQKEDFLKVAFVIAKINHRALSIQDFLKAIFLVDPSFSGSKYQALETIAKGFGTPTA